MSAFSLAAPSVQHLSPYLPGKPISELQRELGLSKIIKLASNENPLGPSPRAVEAVREALPILHRYPDGSGFELKAALADVLNVTPSQITLGNGSNDVLEIIARTFLTPGLNAVFSEHAFAVYPLVTQAIGAVSLVARAHDGTYGPRYGHDLTAIADVVNSHTRIVFIANPNNPTGTYLSKNALRTFLESLPEWVIVIIDEAYFEYVDIPDYPHTLEWLSDFPRLIVTRTFSKAYGLAGLRVGYAVSSEDIANMLNRVRQPFNVNALALVGAKAALEDQDHLIQSIQSNTAGLAQWTQCIREWPLDFIPSIANFITLDVGRPAGPVFEALLREGIIVRPVANYGLPHHLRVTIGTSEQNACCLKALKRLLQHD